MKRALGFRDQLAQIKPFRLIDADETVFKKLHTVRIARKGNHDQIGGGDPVCPQRVKFIGFMENHLIGNHGKLPVAGSHNDVAAVYAKQLPEVMGFALIHKIFHIFEIMDRIYGSDVKFFF